MMDITPQEDRLVAAAIAAMGQAYAPYSNFPVGAAILDEDGRDTLWVDGLYSNPT